MSNKFKQAARGTDIYTKIEARTILATGCWFWRGSHNPKGYAKVMEPHLNGKSKTMTVSRVLLARKLGRDLAPGEVARHTCDVPGCVNPEHLIPGSYADNTADMMARGRAANLRGEDAGSSKLTKNQVCEIFYATGLQREIALRFGVSRSLVGMIKLGKTWAHLGLHKTASTISRADG